MTSGNIGRARDAEEGYKSLDLFDLKRDTFRRHTGRILNCRIADLLECRWYPDEDRQ